MPLPQARKLMKSINPAWKMGKTSDGIPQISRTFKFKDFKAAMAFLNKLARVAEAQGHHPNFALYGWNNVRVEYYTHAIKGLHENDFIMAAKTDALQHVS